MHVRGCKSQGELQATATSSFNSLDTVRSGILNDTMSILADTIDTERGKMRESNFNPVAKSRRIGLPVNGTLAIKPSLEKVSGPCSLHSSKPGTQIQTDVSQESPAMPDTLGLIPSICEKMNDPAHFRRGHERGMSAFCHRASSSRRKRPENYQPTSSINLYSRFMKDM